MIIGLHRCITEAEEEKQEKWFRTIRIISISVLHLISECTGFCYLPFFPSLDKMYGLFRLLFPPSWIRDGIFLVG